MLNHTPAETSWFCVRSQPGRQNVAAAHLRSFGVEVFNPHLCRRVASRRGVIRRQEALFPNYLFAQFDADTQHRRVRYAFGVAALVSFGGSWARIAAGEITRMREIYGPAEAITVPEALAPGTRVALSGALFHGLEAEVLSLLPARQRVKVLLDFLGGPKEAEVEAAQVVPILAHPLAA